MELLLHGQERQDSLVNRLSLLGGKTGWTADWSEIPVKQSDNRLCV